MSGDSLDTNLLSTSRVAKDTFLPHLRASGAEEKYLSPPLSKEHRKAIMHDRFSYFHKDGFVSVDFEDALINEFSKLDHKKFRVNLSKHHIFVCGGVVNAKADISPSFRDRFIAHTANNEDKIHDAIVLAENFKDYFKENTYNDLLVFEDEIANISTLVIIFLESPGSLVELGMFCTKPNFYKKLVIVAPQERTESEDSFIYLGPLEYIRKKEETSVAIYPWPSSEQEKYDKDYLVDLCETINEKLGSLPKLVTFNKNNSGHVAFLVYEIIRLCYPILVGEIELVFEALDLNINESEINRHLYLLSKLQLISHNFYSNYRYYYPLYKDLKTVKFGKNKSDKVDDSQKIQMSINQSYVLSDEPKSRKRRSAKKQIMLKLKGEAQ